MGKTVRSSSKDFPGIGAAQSVERWKKHRSTQTCAVDGWEGDRSPQTYLFSTCLDRALKKKRVKSHVTMLVARGRMDAEVVDIRETERGFQAGMPPVESLEYGDKSENDPFQNSEGAGKKETGAGQRHVRPHPQSSSLCAPRLRTCLWDRGDMEGVEEITKSAKKCTRAKKGAGICRGTRTKSIPHTMQCTLLKRHSDRQNVTDRKQCWAQELFTSYALCGQVSLLQW